MKGQLFKIIILLVFLPVRLFAQSSTTDEMDITGVWKGLLYNDTTQKYLPYEIAISEEKGKLSGYSYTLFDIDGKKELGIKKIKIIRRNDQLTIEDVELISNNYSAPPPRRVRQQSVVNLSGKDTLMKLNGNWSTNSTREYRPLTGTLQLQRSADYHPMTLFKKLVELKLDQDLSFVKAGMKPKRDIAVIEKPVNEIKSPQPAAQPDIDAKPREIIASPAEQKNEVAVVEKPVLIKPVEILTVVPAKDTVASEPVLAKINKASDLTIIVNTPVTKKPAIIISSSAVKKTKDRAVMEPVIIKNNPANELAKKPADQPKIITTLPAVNKKEVVATLNTGKKENAPPVPEKAKLIPVPTVSKKPEPVAVKEPVKTKPGAGIVKSTATDTKPKASAPVAVNSKPAPPAVIAIAPPAEKKTAIPAEAAVPAGTAAAADVAVRKMKNEQSVYFESDSLVLTLYDNGEVDGDTVSVLMNGQIIFAKQGLTTKANTKTIYIDKSMPDTLSMVMYAENLGSIPPNTGLMIIMDGEKRYEVRFSADLQTNAAILFRRKPKEK